MKKKKIVSVIFVSFVLIATTIITSCSSEYEEEMIDFTSLQQKEKIEQLAKEYGLSIELKDDFFATRAGSDQDIENELAMMASLLGEYEIMGEQNGDTIVLSGLGSDLFSINRIPPSNEITGNIDLNDTEFETYHGTGITLNLCFEISISLHWDFRFHNSASITGAVITELYSSSIFYPTITDSHVTVVGGVPTIVFSCNLILTDWLGNYYYTVSGDYCPSTGIGTIQVL